MDISSRSPSKRRNQINVFKTETSEDKILCRTDQVKVLRSLFELPSTFPTIFAFGHSSTGKTYTIRTLLQDCKVPHIWINCIVVYSQRLLFEAIITQVLRLNLAQDGGDICATSCDNACDFLYQFKNAFKDMTQEGPTVHLVFDGAEKLCDMPPTVLSTIIRLQELTELKLCVILISENSWDKFLFGVHFPEPYILHFPQYSKEDVLSILLKDCPEGNTTEFYGSYLKLVIHLCFIVTRDLQELRYIALSNFGKYCEPIHTDEANEWNKHKLWKMVEPHLKNTLNTVYLRESSVLSEFERTTSEALTFNVVANRANVELPFFSKFLLLASYIASYNPVKADKQMFVKNCGRIRKRNIQKVKKRIVAQHERGPKAFPFQRLLAIFYSIIEEDPKPTTYLLHQMSTLVSLRLLSPVGNDLDFPKYKCIVSLDFIKSIARTVSFDIMGYLTDFIQL